MSQSDTTPAFTIDLFTNKSLISCLKYIFINTCLPCFTYINHTPMHPPYITIQHRFTKFYARQSAVSFINNRTVSLCLYRLFRVKTLPFEYITSPINFMRFREKFWRQSVVIRETRKTCSFVITYEWKKHKAIYF